MKDVVFVWILSLTEEFLIVVSTGMCLITLYSTKLFCISGGEGGQGLAEVGALGGICHSVVLLVLCLFRRD